MRGFAGITLRALMLLALITWIGGIIFFSFVLAPTVFTVLPTTKLAGDVVSVSLSKMHWMALVSGLLFLLASFIYQAIMYQAITVKSDNLADESHSKLIWATHLLVIAMLALTWISQSVITPKIRDLRIEMASAQGISTEHRAQFDRLHAWSTRAEGGVFFCGLVVVVLTAKRFGD
jgi:uncharacterized membrane protein